jgi:hypothetical protein
MTDLYQLRRQLRDAKARLATAQRIDRRAELSYYYHQWDGRRAAACDAAREKAWEMATVVQRLEDQIATLRWEQLNPQFA